MKESNIKLAQQDIDEALKTVEDLERVIDEDGVSKYTLKEKFITLSERLQKLEDLLKSEGIL